MTCNIYVPSFEPKGHFYKDDRDESLDGVTNTLSIELNLPTGKWLLPYAHKGTCVDMACEMWDQNDLHEPTLSEDVRQHVEQYKLALSHYGIKVLQNKIRRYHPVYRIAGELDKIAIIDGCIWVIDLKTTKEHSIHHKWQTAVYMEMIKDELSSLYPNMPQKRGCLYLRPDSFELVEHTEENNFVEFLALHCACKIKQTNGYARKKKQCEWDI